MSIAVDTKLVEQVSELFERGVLIDLDISWWAGQARLRPEDIGIPKENLNEELFSLGRKRFIPKNWIGRFRKYEQKGRQLVDKYSFHFKRGGGWFVPLKAIPELVKLLEECRDKFFGVIAEFAKLYPQIKKNMVENYQKELPKIYRRMKLLGAKVPGEDAFAERFMSAVKAFYPSNPAELFKFRWSFFEFSMPREFKLKELKVQKKLAKVEREKQKERMLIQQYRDTFQDQINSFLHSVVTELRGATVELTERVARQITEGKVTDNRLERLREFIQRFRLLNFVDDAEVSKALNDLQERLGHSAEEYNSNEELSAALGGSLKNVVKVASKNGTNVIAASFGVKRKIIRKKK